MDGSLLTVSGLGLVLLLGLRHGLDPDHIAIIDNLTLQAIDQRPQLSRWIGSLFALGHSLSVGAVAIAVAIFQPRVTVSGWVVNAEAGAVIALLLGIGAANLHGLSRNRAGAPAGWRHYLLPRSLRRNHHPAAIIAVGVIFGLAFDTITQAAAWGLVASSQAGIMGAVIVTAVFSLGMCATDTVDSWIVARLLRSGSNSGSLGNYRRRAGWLIVALSFGMAGYAFVEQQSVAPPDLPDWAFTALGVTMAVLVIGLLWRAANLPEQEGRRRL